MSPYAVWCRSKMAHNEQGLAMGQYLKNVSPSPVLIKNTKIEVQNHSLAYSSAGTKAKCGQ